MGIEVKFFRLPLKISNVSGEDLALAVAVGGGQLRTVDREARGNAQKYQCEPSVSGVMKSTTTE